VVCPLPLAGFDAPSCSTIYRDNPTRKDFRERFQKLIDGYNSASQNIEAFFNTLMRLAEELSEEEQETIREGLTEEEKALFDILDKPEPELTEKTCAGEGRSCRPAAPT
jgi:type I restriction enzyme R subunit